MDEAERSQRVGQAHVRGVCATSTPPMYTIPDRMPRTHASTLPRDRAADLILRHRLTSARGFRQNMNDVIKRVTPGQVSVVVQGRLAKRGAVVTVYPLDTPEQAVAALRAAGGVEKGKSDAFTKAEMELFLYRTETGKHNDRMGKVGGSDWWSGMGSGNEISRGRVAQDPATGGWLPLATLGPGANTVADHYEALILSRPAPPVINDQMTDEQAMGQSYSAHGGGTDGHDGTCHNTALARHEGGRGGGVGGVRGGSSRRRGRGSCLAEKGMSVRVAHWCLGGAVHRERWRRSRAPHTVPGSRYRGRMREVCDRSRPVAMIATSGTAAPPSSPRSRETRADILPGGRKGSPGKGPAHQPQESSGFGRRRSRRSPFRGATSLQRRRLRRSPFTRNLVQQYVHVLMYSVDADCVRCARSKKYKMLKVVLYKILCFK